MVWPGNVAGDVMKRILSQDRLLYTVEHAREAAPCVLRPLLLRPLNFSFRLVPYRYTDEIIAACRRNASSPRVTFMSSLRSPSTSSSSRRKQWLAVQVRMQLPANAYATMLLRELMRSAPGVYDLY